MILPEHKTKQFALCIDDCDWDLTETCVIKRDFRRKSKMEDDQGRWVVCSVLFCRVKTEREKQNGHSWERGIRLLQHQVEVSWKCVVVVDSCSWTTTQHPVGDASCSARSHWLLWVCSVFCRSRFQIRAAPTQLVALRLFCKPVTLQDYSCR